MQTSWWQKFLSRRFLLAVLGVAVVVAGEWFGVDEGAAQSIGEKLVWIIGVFVGGESLVDAARLLLVPK